MSPKKQLDLQRLMKPSRKLFVRESQLSRTAKAATKSPEEYVQFVSQFLINEKHMVADRETTKVHYGPLASKDGLITTKRKNGEIFLHHALTITNKPLGLWQKIKNLV